MYLKRVYNREAPADQWSTRIDDCSKCDRGFKIRFTKDGKPLDITPCPEC